MKSMYITYYIYGGITYLLQIMSSYVLIFQILIWRKMLCHFFSIFKEDLAGPKPIAESVWAMFCHLMQAYPIVPIRLLLRRRILWFHYLHTSKRFSYLLQKSAFFNEKIREIISVVMVIRLKCGVFLSFDFS